MDTKVLDSLYEMIDDRAYRMIISKPAHKAEAQYKKIEILLKEDFYQATCYTEKQVFHKNFSFDEVKSYLSTTLDTEYFQMNAWSDSYEYQFMNNKKGHAILKRKALPGTVIKKETSHNREKNYLLKEGTVIPPLVDMGIFSKEGKVNPSMYDKFKQINRFVEIIDDSLKTYKPDSDRPLKIVDFGCGKSYLTFILYYFFTEVKRMPVTMIGLDLKEDVIEKCNASAAKYGYTNLKFMVGDIGLYADDTPADMVITLHACDTATDYALFHAINWNAKMIFSVPCCQHELNAQFKADSMSILGRYGIIKERTAALMTDAIRANLLECCNYKTQLLEFVDFENTPKNLLIRAVLKEKKLASKSELLKKDSYRAEVEELMRTFNLKPTLYSLVKDRL